MNNLVLVISIMLLSFSLFGQEQKFQLINSKPIDPKRYKTVEGDPYLFKKWKLGRLVDSESKIVDSVYINYNGFTSAFEVRQGEEYVELESHYYPLVKLYMEDGSEAFFKRNNFKELYNRYSRIVYSGTDVFVFQNLSVKKDITPTKYGGVDDTEKFVRRKKYYLLHNDKLKVIRLNKKSILKNLDHEDELSKFIKKNKISLKSEEDLGKLLTYFETLG